MATARLAMAATARAERGNGKVDQIPTDCFRALEGATAEGCVMTSENSAVNVQALRVIPKMDRAGARDAPEAQAVRGRDHPPTVALWSGGIVAAPVHYRVSTPLMGGAAGSQALQVEPRAFHAPPGYVATSSMQST